jgi:uncharacterized protein YaiE (UPF0345 family)
MRQAGRIDKRLCSYFYFSVNKGEVEGLNASASSATRSACAVVGYGGDFFDTFNAKAEPCKCADGCLGAWTRSSWATASRGANFDVYGSYAFVAGNFCGSCGCAHGCVG